MRGLCVQRVKTGRERWVNERLWNMRACGLNSSVQKHFVDFRGVGKACLKVGLFAQLGAAKADAGNAKRGHVAKQAL